MYNIEAQNLKNKVRTVAWWCPPPTIDTHTHTTTCAEAHYASCTILGSGSSVREAFTLISHSHWQMLHSNVNKDCLLWNFLKCASGCIDIFNTIWLMTNIQSFWLNHISLKVVRKHWRNVPFMVSHVMLPRVNDSVGFIDELSSWLLQSVTFSIIVFPAQCNKKLLKCFITHHDHVFEHCWVMQEAIQVCTAGPSSVCSDTHRLGMAVWHEGRGYRVHAECAGQWTRERDLLVHSF